MLGDVILTKHFKRRSRSRIAPTSRMPELTSAALRDGIPATKVRNKLLRTKLLDLESAYQSSCRIYKNQIFWFIGQTAITVYPLPQNLHHKI